MGTALLFIVTLWAPASDTLDVDPEQERLIEEIIEVDADAAELTERLHEGTSWRVDLNTASEEALLRIPGITDSEAAALVAFRRRGGRLRSADDLRRAGLSQEALLSIRPFVTFQRSARRLQLEIVQRWTRRLDLGRGYDGDTTRTSYLGSPDAVHTRLRLQIGDRVKLGGTFDKDAGERFAWSPPGQQFGFDFTAGFLAIEDLGPFSHLIAGDFSIDLGEGLVLGQSRSRSSSFGKIRSPVRLRPHSSSREYGFFRGIGFQTRTWRGWSAAGFASQKSIDGRIDSTSWSVAATGLHRTENELVGRGLIDERAIGAGIFYRHAFLNVGIAVTDIGHRIRSSRRSTQGLYGFAIFSRGALRLAIEAARRETVPVFASLASLELGPAGRIWIRALDAFPGARAVHASFGVDGGGRSRRESSYEAGVQVRPAEYVGTTFFARWRDVRPESLLPNWTIDFVASIDVEARPWLRVHMRASEKRAESEDRCPVGAQALRCSVPSTTRRLRLQVDYVHSRSLRTRFRVEAAENRTGPGSPAARGMLLFEDVRWQPRSGVRIDARLVVFDVRSYDARLYAVENDLRYTFSAPQFSGRGLRHYVLAQIAPAKGVAVQIKYGVTTYEDVRSVGSGLDETPGRRLRDLRVQVRLRLE